MTNRGFTILLPVVFLVISTIIHAEDADSRTGRMWETLQWSVKNSSIQGNPYDVEASATFRHSSGETRTTGMFYDGDDTWKFRFTGTQTGEWKFFTTSLDPELSGMSGTVIVKPNPDPQAHGFIKSFGNKWGWQGTEEAFIPQLMMYKTPDEFYGRSDVIDADIKKFIVEHCFTGFHVPSIAGRWFDLDGNNDRVNMDMTEPDRRTFESLEMVISKVHAAGGMVHIWGWGDHSRHQTPRDLTGGINGVVDRRLQRYIAARLGPLAGWSIGYGFDLDEWVDEEGLKQWHIYMHEHLGWHHFLGGRSSGPNHGTDHKGYQIYDGLDYAGYEHHRPTYAVYVAALEMNPHKPVFSEDRFRIRHPSSYPEKDYTEQLTRRGLWDSAMAGGVANIWGKLTDGPSYENIHWFKSYYLFFKHRFLKEMLRDNSITDGVCLKTPDREHFIFYKEKAGSISIDLSEMHSAQPAVAMDALKPYEEINCGQLEAKEQTWQAPYKSDWAIAVGKF